MAHHEVSRDVPFAPEILFDLVADVERYPEFVPWWVAARVKRVSPVMYYTDQVVALKVLHRGFRTKTVLQRPDRIDVTSTDKPFKQLQLVWTFEPLPEGCRVRLSAAFQFRSGAIQAMLGLFSQDMVHRLLDAFESRAQSMFGESRLAAPRAGIGFVGSDA